MVTVVLKWLEERNFDLTDGNSKKLADMSPNELIDAASHAERILEKMAKEKAQENQLG